MIASLKRDTLVYGTAVLTERAVSFLLLPVLTKMLSPDLFGVWSQIIITIGLLSSLLLLHLHTALVNTFSGDAKEPAPKYLAFHGILFVALIAAAIVLVGLWACESLMSRAVFGHEEFHAFIPLLGLLLATEALFELTIAFLRSAQQVARLSLYYTVKNLGRLALMAGGLVFFQVDLYDTILWVGLWQAALVGFIYVKDIFTQTIPIVVSESLSHMKSLLSFSLPLVPLGIMLWGNSFLDRYLILHFLGLEQVGIYAVTYSLAATTAVLYSILGFTLYPELTRLWNANDKARAGELVRTSVGYYLLFLVPAIAILTMLGEEIIAVFATKRYLSHWLAMLMIAGGIGLYGLYQIHLYVVLLAKKTLQNLLIVGGSLVLNFVLNLMLLNVFGLTGAAMAILLSNGFLAGCTIMLSRKAAPILFPWLQVGKMLIAVAIMTALLLVAKQSIPLNNFWGLFFAIVIAGAVYLTCYCFSDREMARGLRRLSMS